MARPSFGVGVLVTPSDPEAPTLGLFVAPLRDDVEVVVGHVEHVNASCVGRVGVKHLLGSGVPVEDADTGQFGNRHARARVVVLTLPVGDLLRREGYAVVAVEIAVAYRDPLEGPTHALL